MDDLSELELRLQQKILLFKAELKDELEEMIDQRTAELKKQIAAEIAEARLYMQASLKRVDQEENPLVRRIAGNAVMQQYKLRVAVFKKALSYL